MYDRTTSWARCLDGSAQKSSALVTDPATSTHPVIGVIRRPWSTLNVKMVVQIGLQCPTR